MRKLKFKLAVLFLLFSFQMKAQDFPFRYFTHFNPMVNNPSLAGIDSKMNFHAGSYNLWAGGFKPLNDYLVSFSYSRDNNKYRRNSFYQPRVGLGVVLLHENVGPFTQNYLQLVYSYHIPLDKNTLLSLGISGLFQTMAIDVNSLNPLDNDDPRLLTGNNNSYLFDGGFGAALSGKNYRVSFSGLNLAPSVFTFKNSLAKEVSEYRKFFFSGNYSFQINRSFKLQPELCLRNTIQKKIGYDTALFVDLESFSFGAGYRSEQAVFFVAKVAVENFVFAYISENPIQSNHMIGNGHTISVGWNFDVLKR